MPKIPRIFHQIWLGPDPFPEEFATYQRSWLANHPEWELRMWTEDNLPKDLERKEIYERLRVPAERADLLRLELLKRFGGVYVDADFESLKPIDDLIADAEFFIAELKPGRTNNALIGSVAGHPVLQEAIAAARPREFYGLDKEASGPLLLDRIVKQHPEVTVFEARLFYPSTPFERAGAFAVHHAARSWHEPEDFRETARRAEARLAAVQQEFWDVITTISALQEIADPQQIQAALRRITNEATLYKTMPRLGKGKKAPLAAARTTTKGKVEAAKPVKSRLQEPVSSEKARRKSTSLRQVLSYGATRALRNQIRRATKKLRSVRKRLRAFMTKRLVRSAYRVYNMRYRPFYAHRLDLLPDRDELPFLLNARGLVRRGVEIGVQEGKYSDYLLSTWRGSQLVSVDPWQEAPADEYLDNANVPQQLQDQRFEATCRRLAKYGSRSLIWRMTSAAAAQEIPDASLDFVYIDARHDYESVIEDLSLWFKKVRPGGIIAGHDYVDGTLKQGVFGVKRAVDEFFGSRGLAVYQTQGKWPVELFPSWLAQVPDR